MSYGNGQPAILRDDESIRNCRLLLQHPLSVEDDMRLVSMVELLVIREKVHNKLSDLDRDISEGIRDGIEQEMYDVLKDADVDFRGWFHEWDDQFSTRYPDVS